MKEFYKTLAVLVCWSIAAVAYASGEPWASGSGVLLSRADDGTAVQGAALWVIIALGVLVAVLVLLLLLATGAWLYSRNKIAALNR